MQTNSQSRLIDATDVARILGISKRTVYRLADSGKMPKPIKLNAVTRWDREAVLSWVDKGCPAQEPAK